MLKHRRRAVRSLEVTGARNVERVASHLYPFIGLQRTHTLGVNKLVNYSPLLMCGPGVRNGQSNTHILLVCADRRLAKCMSGIYFSETARSAPWEIKASRAPVKPT